MPIRIACLVFLAALAFPLVLHADSASHEHRSHATDCTGESNAVQGDKCMEIDDNTIYVCETATCNTAGWVQYSGTLTWCHTHGDVSGAPITNADHHYDYYRAPADITVTEIWCTTDAGTYTMNIENEDGSPVDIMGSDLACDADGEVDSSPSGDTTVADGDTLSMVATSTADTPRTVTWCVEYTRD